jgi:putative membrane protein
LSEAVVDMMEAPLVEGERTHPLGLFIGFITGLPQLLFPMAAALYGSRNIDIGMPLIIGAVLLISLFFRWIAWLRFRFYLDEDDIRIEQGLLNRTVRSIPYDRIQDISIEEKLLARIMGLGEVKFETGGGDGGDDATLSYVSMERAEALRATIRAHKNDVAIVADDAVLARETPPVFAMDGQRLVTLGLYSFSLVIFAVLGGLAQQFDFLLPFEWWDFKHWIGMAEDRGVSVDGIGNGSRVIWALGALFGLIAIGVASGVVRTFLKEYGFRLDRTERGFRRRRGLFTKTDVTMPINRVQGASITTGPIRKRRGWHALKFISLAQDSKEESDFVAAPLARLDELWPIARETGLDALDLDNTALRKSRLLWWLTGTIGFAVVLMAVTMALIFVLNAPVSRAGLIMLLPLLFAAFAWLEWRNYGDLIDDQQLYVREGWWRQRLALVRQINVQSAEIHQGPIARMLGQCTLNFGIAGGTLAFSALPLDQARAIRDQVMTTAAPIDFSELNRRD